MDKQILESFWEAVPDSVTIEEMADGIDVTFIFKGKSYTVNTLIKHARTKSFETCYKIWDNRALRSVNHTN